MGSTASLIWGMLFGSIGVGYCMYGRSQRLGIPLACGIALIFFPYFVSSTILLVLIGVALVLLPWFVRGY